MKHFTYLIAVLVLLVVGQTAQGAVLDSCDQWASYCSGSYCVYNAVWGATGNWSQCINASSCTQWTVTATHPGNGIKSYPNSSYESINGTTVGQLSSCSSSVSTSPPSGGTYNLSYDFWAPIEVMVWLKWQGSIGPWGSYVTTASIGGRSYDVYKNGYPGFLLQSQTSGGTFDLKAIMDYCVSRGWLTTGGNIEKIQCGYEIVEASNTTFKMNSYSVSYSTGGGSTTTTASSTSTTTTASSTSTTASSTSTTSGGSGNITMRARGVQGSEYLELRANGSKIGGWTMSTSYQNYSASGSGTIQVCFTNDDGGRDAQVDYVIIDGTTYQSEDQADNTGVWQNNSCGGSYSEWLQCNGCITYSGGGGGTTTTASSTSTTTTASSTSTTTTASSTSTTTTASSTSTTSGSGGCDCGTCNWYGSSIPMCCESCSGWGWYDGGCQRSCVCPSSCEGGSVP